MTRTELGVSGLDADILWRNGQSSLIYGTGGTRAYRFFRDGRYAFTDPAGNGWLSTGEALGPLNNQQPLIPGDATCPGAIALKQYGPDPAPVTVDGVVIGHCYAAGKLSRLQFLNGAYVLTTSTDMPLLEPCYAKDGSADVISQAQNGGILCTLDGVTGTLFPGGDVGTYLPRFDKAPDGTYSIVYSQLHPGGPLVRLDGVTAADLKPAPPPDYPVTPLTKPTLFGCFDKVTWPSWANARTQDAGYPQSGILGHAAPPQGMIDMALSGGFDWPEYMTVKWNMFDLESGTGNRAHPCCYNGTWESIVAAEIEDNPYDILSPWCYPEPGETPEQFRVKAQTLIDRMHFVYQGMTVAPVWRVDTRIGPNGPTLTEDQVLHCLSIASSFGLPALFFQGDRAGFVESAVPLLEKWRAGQPCSVPIQPVPPPTQDAAALLLLKGLS